MGTNGDAVKKDRINTKGKKQISAATLFFLVFGAPSFLGAETFTVNNRLDLQDELPGDGICRAVQNTDRKRLFNCTLRAAIMEANALPGADTVKLGRGTYRLTIEGTTDEKEGRIGDLDIVDKLIIKGRGKEKTIIDASAITNRIFDIHDPSVVSIEGMTLTGGKVLGPQWNRYDNQVIDYTCPIIKPPDGTDGGALLNRGGIVDIKDVKFEDNLALCDGGAVENFNDGMMRLVDCDFAFNTAIANGGAIENDEDSIMIIKNANFIWNNADENGGAVASDDSIMMLRESKLQFNAAYQYGGGIWNGDSDAMMVKDTTIRYNDAVSGGGIYNNDGFLMLRNNIIERNSPNDIHDEQIDEGLPQQNDDGLAQ